MNKITVRIANILTGATLLLYSVCILCSFLLQKLAQTLYSFPSGVFLTLAVMLPTAVLLINAIVQLKKGGGKYAVVRQGMLLLLCVAWLVLTVVYWLYSLSYYTALMSGQFTAEIVSRFSFTTTIYNVAIGFIMLFWLISYAINVMRTKQKWLQIKAELHKPAVVLIVFVSNILSLINTVVSVFIRNTSTEIVSRVNIVSYYVQFFVMLLMGVLCAAAVLIFGLIFKKQPAGKVQEPESAYEQKQPDDLPFNVPAGVNADDL